MMIYWLIFVVTSLNLLSIKGNAIDGPSNCTNFKKIYQQLTTLDEQNAFLDQIKRECGNLPAYKYCGKPTLNKLRMQFQQNTYFHHDFYLNVRMLDHSYQENQCLGLIMEMDYYVLNGTRIVKKQLITKELMNDYRREVGKDYLIDYNTTFTFQIVQIPTGWKAVVSRTTLTKCESFMWMVLDTHKEAGPLAYYDPKKCTSKYAKKLRSNQTDGEPFKYEDMKIAVFEHCKRSAYEAPPTRSTTVLPTRSTTVLPTRSTTVGGDLTETAENPTETAENSHLVVATSIVAGVATASAILLLALLLFRKRGCTRLLNPLLHSYNIENPVQNPNILLINQPGCLVLKEIVEKLSLYLKSHGANVKVMLEDDGHEIDVNGGIQAFLTRNISQHHFVLMLFSKNFEGLQHRHKKILHTSSHLIEGLITLNEKNMNTHLCALFLENSDTRLIPQNLSALKMSRFNIPRDLGNLSQSLIKPDVSQLDRHLHENKHLFKKELCSLLKEYRQDPHDDCKTHLCEKGKIVDPSNGAAFSEVWTITTNQMQKLDIDENAIEICDHDNLQHLPDVDPESRCRDWDVENC
ncbi:uncharacterized protein [Clytia hemisphaerica]|uniref:Uncharacterized protein n=1 Tax=Clytia hemisphaerica TaxID=252671 RepID=A0A7M5V169_9CNID